jgi:enediyne biosynthesis protein E4
MQMDIQDLIVAGNFFESRPQTGRYDASYGLVLLGTQSGEFIPLTAGHSGLSVTGAVRSMLLLEEDPSKLLIGINNDSLRIFNVKVHK